MRKSFWEKLKEAQEKGLTSEQLERIEEFESAIAYHENKIEEYEKEIKHIENNAMSKLEQMRYG